MQLALALDLECKEKNLQLLRDIKEFDIWVKVGLRSYIRDGNSFLEEIRSINENFKIFLDLKLYDIPNTMADAVRECVNLGVDMITIHASAGMVAMRAVADVVKGSKTKVFAVSALTSFDDEHFYPIYNANINSHAQTLAKLAYEGGCDGVVCSVFEVEGIKSQTTKSFLTLTPAIRPFGEASDDQKRVANIADAKRCGSDFIVIGRPIYKSENPKESMKKIIEEMQR